MGCAIDYSIDLEPILELAIKGGIDTSCDAYWGHRRYNFKEGFDQQFPQRRNILQQTARLLYIYPNHRRILDVPIIQSLVNLGFEDVALDKELALDRQCFLMPGYVEFLQRYPQLVEGESIEFCRNQDLMLTHNNCRV